MRTFTVLSCMCLLGTGCGLNPETREASETTSKQIGDIGTGLSNGVFTAHVENAEYTQDPLRRNQFAYQFKVVIGNPRKSVLRFDSIEVITTGKDGFEYTTSMQHGQPGELKELRLMPGDGASVVATVPELSVADPEQLRVQVMHEGAVVAEPLVFRITADSLTLSPEIQALRQKQGGMITASRSMDFEGVDPSSLRERAIASAMQWSEMASLREVQSDSFSIYGDADTREVTGINISKWRFSFVADGKARSVIISDKDILSRDESGGTVDFLETLQPIEHWDVSVADVVSIAARQGVNAERGVWLRMYHVLGTQRPLWVVPGAPSVLIDAVTGNLVLHSDVTLK